MANKKYENKNCEVFEMGILLCTESDFYLSNKAERLFIDSGVN